MFNRGALLVLTIVLFFSAFAAAWGHDFHAVQGKHYTTNIDDLSEDQRRFYLNIRNMLNEWRGGRQISRKRGRSSMS